MRFCLSLFLLCGFSCVMWCSATYGSGDVVGEMETYLSEQPKVMRGDSSSSSAAAAAAAALQQHKKENIQNAAPTEAVHVAAAAAAAAAASANKQEQEQQQQQQQSAAIGESNKAPGQQQTEKQQAGRTLLAVKEDHDSQKKNSEMDGATASFKLLFVGGGFWSYLGLGVIGLTVFLYVLREYILAPKAPAGFKLPLIHREGLPAVGTLIAFAKDPLQLLKRGHEKFGGVPFTVRFGPQRITFVTGQEGLEAFFKADDLTLDLGKVYRITVPVFGEGVIYDAPLDKRSQQYKMLSAGLRTAKIISYVPLLEQEVTQYIQRWGESGQIDVATVMSELIILTASRCLLGADIRENMFESVARLFAELDQGMQPISVLAPYLPTKAHATRDRAHKEMCALFSTVIARRRAAAAELASTTASTTTTSSSPASTPTTANTPGALYDDVLESLMHATYRDGTPLTDKEISGMLIALLFAGQHTSSVTASWTGLFLFRNPAMLERVMREQEEAGANKGNLNHDILSRLPVLHACVRESLRMHPPLIFLMRAAIKDLTFGNIAIPKGDIIFASPAHAGRLSEIFTNPNVWDPDRLLAPREEDKKSPVGNLSFGLGRHHCLGETFGLLQVKTIWSTLLRHYEFEAVGPLPLPDYSGMVVGPIHSGCTLKYKRRV